MSEEVDVDEVVDDIIEQLKNSKKECTDLTRNKEYDKITKEKLEEFVIEKSADLVQRSLDIVDEIKDSITAEDDAEKTRALADILKATSSAVDALNKVHIASERNKTATNIAEKNIEARQGMNRENNMTRLTMSREEMMKRLFDKSEDDDPPMRDANPKPKAIETEVLDDDQG